MKSRFIPVLIVLVAVFMVVAHSCKKTPEYNNESVKVDSILAATADLIYVNPDSVGKLYSAVQSEISDSDSYYKLELFKGIAGVIGGNMDVYDESHRKTAGYLRRNPDSHIIAGIYWNHEAMVLNSMGNTDSAIIGYEKSCDEFSSAKDWNRFSNVCINLADVYRSKGKMASSAKCYRRALFIADSTGNHAYDFSILSGLGTVYADMGNFEQSDRFFSRAETFVDKSSDYEAFFFYNSVGNGLYFQKRYDEALESFYKAYSMANKMEQTDLLAISETKLGEVQLYKGCLDSARYYLKSAEARFLSMPSIDESTRFYINSILADLSLKENNLAESRRYLSVVTDTAVLRPKYLALHYGRMQEFYAKSGDYKKAYEYEKLAEMYDKRVSHDMIRSQMSEIRYRYAQDTTLLHKNLMIKEQAEEMRTLSMWNYVAGGALVLLIVVACFYVIYKKKMEAVARLKMEHSLMSLRIENIRNRVSPHFIFNVLNRELASENEGVNKLVKLLRMNLDLCDRYIVPLSDEIEFINIYVDLERKALGDNFTYELNIEEGIDLESYSLPSMMVQIFVENALKHGLRGCDRDKWLRLSVKHEHKSLIILVENNGSNHGVVAGRVGTGLRVVMQTIHILNERNAEKLELNYGIGKEDGLWCVRIEIPDGYDFSIMQ